VKKPSTVQDTLAVVVPSRGLMYSETLEDLLGELEGFKYKIFWSHQRSLPEAFEIPTQEALRDPSVYAILIVEDDMIIPKGSLREMFAQNYPVVALDYPFQQNGDATTLHDPKGMAFWTGTGFILIARQVLENLPNPIWRVGTTFDPFIDKDTLHFWPRKLEGTHYGLHDLYFGLVCYSAGMPIMVLERTAGQRKLKALGTPHSNQGAHDIYELTEVGRDLVSGMINPENSSLFRGALNRVKQVRFWEDIPPFISYDADNQPYLNDGRHYDVVR
jgi:hypothetical protein